MNRCETCKYFETVLKTDTVQDEKIWKLNCYCHNTPRHRRDIRVYKKIPSYEAYCETTDNPEPKGTYMVSCFENYEFKYVKPPRWCNGYKKRETR